MWNGWDEEADALDGPLEVLFDFTRLSMDVLSHHHTDEPPFGDLEQPPLDQVPALAAVLDGLRVPSDKHPIGVRATPVSRPLPRKQGGAHGSGKIPHRYPTRTRTQHALTEAALQQHDMEGASVDGNDDPLTDQGVRARTHVRVGELLRAIDEHGINVALVTAEHMSAIVADISKWVRSREGGGR